MKSALIVFTFLTLISFAEPAKAAGPFDGTWAVVLTAPDFNYNSGIAKGFIFRLTAQVKDGALHGEYGTKDTPPWLAIDGTIKADGSAELHATGTTGRSDYVIGHLAAGTTYGYVIKAHFDGPHGTGSRVGGRPVSFIFERK